MNLKLYSDVEIGNIPPTPSQVTFSSDLLDQARTTLMQYAFHFGYPISYFQEQSGNLVQNIFPVYKTQYEQISTSSKVQLALHTETAFHPYKPDYILLLCLRGDPSAATTYAEINDIVQILPEQTMETLKKPWYITAVDDSFRTNGEPQKEFIMPILRDTDGSLSMTYDNFFMRGINEEADLALAELNVAIEKCTKEIVLKTGDLLVINNSTVIHGRKPFDARYDGTDRWVQRMLVRKHLPPKDQRHGHIIITSFAREDLK